jgi:hypothetical protein
VHIAENAHRVKKEGEELSEEQLGEAFDVVETMRMDWQVRFGDQEAAMQHYKVEHCGSKWTRKHLGVPCDKVHGVPATNLGKAMLLHWRLNLEWGCTFKTYGVESSELMCCGWCHKMAYCLKTWQDSGLSKEFEFEQFHIDAYSEALELAEAVATWPPNHRAHRRLADLRAFHAVG